MRKKKRFVIDSSVAVKWLNTQDEQYIDQADKILKYVQKGKAELIMPELSKHEVGNALLNKGMNLPATKKSLATFYSLPIQFTILEEQLALESTEIANKHQITFYDAIFVALARRLDAVLITNNPKHQKIIKEVRLTLLKDYKSG